MSDEIKNPGNQVSRVGEWQISCILARDSSLRAGRSRRARV
jgi:hypothetical protein